MSISDDAVSVSSTGSTDKTAALQFPSSSEQYQMNSRTKQLPYFRKVNNWVAEDLMERQKSRNAKYRDISQS